MLYCCLLLIVVCLSLYEYDYYDDNYKFSSYFLTPLFPPLSPHSIEPCPGHQIVSLQYTNTGSCFAVAGGDERTKLMDRDGKEIQVFAKGDPYISDLNHTKGI